MYNSYYLSHENCFKGKISEKKDFNSYINRKTTNILRDIFDFRNGIDLNDSVYEKFLTDDKKKDILEYKKFGLTSPQIYNIVYTYIVHVEKYYNKNKVINYLNKDVTHSKKHMELIKSSGYTPEEYRNKKENISDNNSCLSIDEREMKFRANNIIKAEEYSK